MGVILRSDISIEREKEVWELIGKYGSCVYSKECDNTQCGHINEHKIGYACMKAPCAHGTPASDLLSKVPTHLRKDRVAVEAECQPTAAHSCSANQFNSTRGNGLAPVTKRARMLRPEVCQV